MKTFLVKLEGDTLNDLVKVKADHFSVGSLGEISFWEDEDEDVECAHFTK